VAYSTAVLERVRNPQRVGALPDDAEDVGSGTAGDLDRGTRVRVWVRVEGGRIAAARYQVFGCSAAIAAAALVAERLEGAELDGAPDIGPQGVIDALALPPERAHAAEIAVTAARQAVAAVAGKTGRIR